MKLFLFLLLQYCTINDCVAQHVKALSIPQKINYLLPDDTTGRLNYLYDELRIIGFSKTGHIAYVVEPADEACGCYLFEIFIAKDNKILWQWRYMGQEGEDENISVIWQKQKKLFVGKLKQYNILQSSPNTLAMDSSSYSVQVSLAAQSDFGLDMIKELRVFKGKKMVYKKIYKNPSFLLEAYTRGQFQQPYTKKPILLLMTLQRGWEGPPNPKKISLIAF